MEVKVQFTIDLPHELIAALNLNEDTAFQAVLEEDRLTVRVCERETMMAYYDDGYEEGYGEGKTAGYAEGWNDCLLEELEDGIELPENLCPDCRRRKGRKS
jgi:hypothetical protein